MRDVIEALGYVQATGGRRPFVGFSRLFMSLVEQAGVVPDAVVWAGTPTAWGGCGPAICRRLAKYLAVEPEELGADGDWTPLADGTPGSPSTWATVWCGAGLREFRHLFEDEPRVEEGGEIVRAGGFEPLRRYPRVRARS